MVRVLVTDDDEGLREMVAEYLSACCGFEVVEAADGKQGLEKALNEPFDAVLTDNQMPEMTGTEMVRSLRAKQYSPPILMMSGDNPTDAMLNCGINGFLPKPYSLRMVAKQLNELITKQAA